MCQEYLFQTLDSIQYPAEIAVNSGVNSWYTFSSTEFWTKTDNSYEMRSVEGRALTDDVPHEATATVPHTGVLPSLAPQRRSESQSGPRLELSKYPWR